MFRRIQAFISLDSFFLQPILMLWVCPLTLGKAPASGVTLSETSLRCGPEEKIGTASTKAMKNRLCIASLLSFTQKTSTNTIRGTSIHTKSKSPFGVVLISLSSQKKNNALFPPILLLCYYFYRICPR